MQKRDILTDILSKVKVLYIIFGAICIAILIRIIWIQTGTNSDELRTQAVEYSFRNDVIEATRGNILSDDNRILATSIPYYEIRMDLMARGLDSAYFYQNVAALADALHGFFGDRSSEEYRRALISEKEKKNAYFRVNSRKVNYLELQTIKKFPIFELGPNKGGFLAVESGRRVQPYGKLATRSIGFVNSNGLRVGIEGGFEDYLRGKDGVSLMQKISGKFWIPVSSPMNIEPINGMDVVTTINIELQDFVQSALSDHLNSQEADWGTVVVMECKSGHIKAIANATRKSSGEIVEDYNYAIGMSQEPGSTFKLAALIALLDDAGMPITEMIETGGGRAQIGPVTVVDATQGGYGTLSLKGVFEKSSNVGFAKAVNKYYGNNPARYVEAITKLGLHKELGLQIAGEARPVIKHPKLRNGWDGMTLTMMSYGYALRITPMQTLALYNAVANNGTMIKPLFVQQLRQYGDTIAQYNADVLIPSICSDKSLRDVKAAMEGVVKNGTAARIMKDASYTSAAKTGTAQIAIGNRGYRENGGRHYLASMAGYFPADNPQYTMVVVLKTFHRDGSSKAYYGGSLSGPLYRKVSDYIFNSNYDIVKPVVPTPYLAQEAIKTKGNNDNGLKEVFSELNIPATTPVVNTIPQIEDTLKRAIPIPPNDVRGLTFADAIKRLENMGYRVTSTGRGVVVNQIVDSLDGKNVVIQLQ